MSGRIPMVSVIIPTCNRARLVPRALGSVLSQTFTDYEIIVIDDCSNDDTQDVIRKYNNNNLRYCRHRTRMGGSAARNTGIAMANGKYVAFLDDDDEWMPEKIRLQVDMLDNDHDIGLVYTGYNYVDDIDKRIIKTFYPKKNGDIYAELLRNNCVGTTSTALVRRECFERAGVFDSGLPACQDWDQWIRISKLFKIGYIGNPLINFYIHDNRITRNVKAKITGRKILLDKHFNEINKDDYALSCHCFFIGYLLCHDGDTNNGRDYIIKSIKLYPYSPYYFKYLLLSFVGSFLYKKLLEFKSILGSERN